MVLISNDRDGPVGPRVILMDRVVSNNQWKGVLSRAEIVYCALMRLGVVFVV